MNSIIHLKRMYLNVFFVLKCKIKRYHRNSRSPPPVSSYVAKNSTRPGTQINRKINYQSSVIRFLTNSSNLEEMSFFTAQIFISLEWSKNFTYVWQGGGWHVNPYDILGIPSCLSRPCFQRVDINDSGFEASTCF